MADLSEKAKALRSKHQREWRRRNPERIRQYNATYWERRAAKEAEAERIRLAEWSNRNRCVVCGKALEDKRDGAKFCSSACKQRFYRKNNTK
jgi:NADH pyrophosphatase NudC (nudix superfamily)